MHPRVLAQRQGAAQDRMRAAAATLAEKHGLPTELAAALSVYDRDPETRGVMRQEAVADLLEALVKHEPAPQPAGGGSDSLEDLTVADLKEIAEERGVELRAGMKKAEIIQALEAHTQGVTPAQAGSQEGPPPVQVPEATEEEPPVSSHPAGDAPPASSGEVK